MARTSSLNCLSCRDPNQTLPSLNCLPPLHWKALLFTEKCFVAYPSQKSAREGCGCPRFFAGRKSSGKLRRLCQVQIKHAKKFSIKNLGAPKNPPRPRNSLCRPFSCILKGRDAPNIKNLRRQASLGGGSGVRLFAEPPRSSEKKAKKNPRDPPVLKGDHGKRIRYGE